MLREVLHIGVTVKNIDRSISFYKNILGLNFEGQLVMEGIETEKLFGIKDCKVKIAYLNGSKELFSPPIELIQFVTDNTITNSANLQKTSISEICFKVDDIAKTFLDLKHKGVEFISEPQTFDFTSQGFGKSKAVYFKDPDGIILELMELVD